jgi:protein-disulfide isomerase
VTRTDGTLTIPVSHADHVLGDEGAAITLVEYGDYECPYCGSAFPIVKTLQREFGDALRLVFRNFPLTNVHPFAERAAEVAEAAGLQGRFWPVHDLLYEHQDDLGYEALLRYAALAGANESEVEAAVSRGETKTRIQRDIEGAIRSGANGTPTFFVNGRRYDGSWEHEPFAAHLRKILAKDPQRG